MKEHILSQYEIDGVLTEVYEEYSARAEKLGPDHDGEYSTETFIQLIQDYAGWARPGIGQQNLQQTRKRLVQVAALAVSAVLAMDRADARLKK